MKYLGWIAIILVLASCSSKKVKEQSSDELDSGAIVEDVSPQASGSKMEESAPKKQETTATSAQVNALNEAIKSQNDERIYQVSTQIIMQSPNDPKALNALAMYHYKRGRYDLCRYLLNKAITANPRSGELYSNLGVVQLAQNERRDAVKSFRKALEVNSQEGIAAANLGSLYTQDKDYSKAQIALEVAYKRGIRDWRVLNNYGVALTANKKYDRAEEMYKAALKDSNNGDVLLNYTILLIDHMGKYQQGLDLIDRLKFVGGTSETRNRIIALENKAKAGLK